VKNSLPSELKKHTGLAITCANRLVVWVQRHYGPLHNQVDARKPLWSFEEAASPRIAEQESANALKNADLVHSLASSVKINPGRSIASENGSDAVATAKSVPGPNFAEGVSKIALEGKEFGIYS
jgi:hypothetical protein